MVIEQAMVCALGALGASLLWLLALPLVERRAGRRADERLRHHLSMALIASNAEKERLRAGHAMDLRRLEQAVEASQSRLATLMSESGRQVSRIVALEREATAATAALSEGAAALAEATRAGQEAQARIEAQDQALRDVRVLEEGHVARLATVEGRLAAVESTNDAHRATIAALETRAAGDELRLGTALAEAARLAGELNEAKAAMDKTADERDIARADGLLAAKARDALKARVDDLAAALAGLEGERDAGGTALAQSEQRVAVHAATITGLADRITAQDAERDTLHRLLDESEARRDALQAERLRLLAERDAAADAGTPPTDRAAALRDAVTALAADLVGFATAGAGPAPPEPVETTAPA